MKSSVSLPFLLACIVMSLGCGHTAPVTLLEYVNAPEHGVTQEADLRDNHISLQYIPTDLQVLSVNGKDLSSAALKAERARYDSFMYFRFTIQNDVYIPAPDTLSYLTFNMQNDLMLIAGKSDTIPCVFYQKIAAGSSHKHEFIVVFDRHLQPQQDFRFVYADKAFGLPAVSFSFRGKDLESIPQL
jgi:hypothetical protein